MKSFTNKYRHIIKETLIFLIFTIMYMIILVKLNKTFGQTVGDFEAQHVRFINYLRNSFFTTHDLAPQMTMNFGGTQNMASLFYHGQYNPLIMLSYLFPFINTANWLRILFVVLTTISFFAMNILLEQHHIKKPIRIVVSIMTIFTLPFLFQSGNHILFLYYYPIMIISLISIRLLIRKQKIWLFVICVALIFYTNFFFALIIGFMQLMYFIVFLYYENNFDRKERIIRYRKLLLGYLIGTLIGVFILLPQLLIVLNSERTGEMQKVIPFFYNGWVEQIVIRRYAGGLGVVIPTVLIMSIINYKDKFNLILIVAALLCIMIGPFNYLLNIFQYLHAKVFIYTIPVIMLVLARVLNSNQKDRKFAFILFFSMIFTLLLVYVDKTETYRSEKYRYLLMGYFVIQALILFTLYYKLKHKWVLSIATLVLIGVLTKSNQPSFIKNYQMNSAVRHQNIIAKDFHLDKKDDFYRTISDVNFVRAINEYSPSLYVSLANGDMNIFNRYTVEMEGYKFSRKVQNSAYKNIFMRNLLGINTYVDRNIGKETKFNNVKPFIYGVYNNNIYNQNSLDKQTKFERLFSLNEHVYTIDSKKISLKKNYHIKNILNDKKVYLAKDLHGKVYQIPKQYQKNGVIIMRMDNVSEQVALTRIKVNTHINYFYQKNTYREEPHTRGYYFFDASADLKNLLVQADLNYQKFSNIKIDYISQSDLDRNFMKDYIKANNIKIDSNKAYDFDINMQQDGMLATSIFYDKGFDILVDNKPVANEKINDNFLGAKLAKGNHHIKITYSMPGFKEGLIISVIGLFILAFIMINEIKTLNKPFFRFVIVGIFNTINYFIMFTILHGLGVEYVLAHLCAFLYSAFVSYFITTYYTFKTKPTLKTMISFPITYLPNLILSTLGTIVLVENHIISESVASLVVMIISIPITFLISKTIFNKKK